MIWIGLFLLLVAGVLGWKTREINRRMNFLERTETMTVADLRAMQSAAAEAAGPGHFRLTCEVVGAARAHKNGLLKSQLKEVQCVWHRHKITRKYEEIGRDSKGRRTRTTKHETVSQHVSGKAFFVEDNSGQVVIRPEAARVVGASKPLNTFEPHQGGGGGDREVRLGPIRLRGGGGSGGTIGYKREEWVLHAGGKLFVHGEATDVNGYLEIGKPAEAGEFIVSGTSEAELLSRDSKELMVGGVATGAAFLGAVVLIVLSLVR